MNFCIYSHKLNEILKIPQLNKAQQNIFTKACVFKSITSLLYISKIILYAFNLFPFQSEHLQWHITFTNFRNYVKGCRCQIKAIPLKRFSYNPHQTWHNINKNLVILHQLQQILSPSTNHSSIIHSVRTNFITFLYMSCNTMYIMSNN